MVDGTTAALTPSAVSLASTWDINVVAGIGHLLATEMKDKQADILLAPTGGRSKSDIAIMHILISDSVSPPLASWWEKFRVLLRR